MFPLSRLCTCDIPGVASIDPVFAMFTLKKTIHRDLGHLTNQIVYSYLFCDALFLTKDH